LTFPVIESQGPMTESETIIAAFCAQFTPPLRYVRTERINNLPMQDAWQTSYWDGARSIGITTVAYGGGLHAFIEAAGKGDIAETAGRVIATALGLFNKELAEDGGEKEV
jgi:hypothetical protein